MMDTQFAPVYSSEELPNGIAGFGTAFEPESTFSFNGLLIFNGLTPNSKAAALFGAS